MEPPSTSLLFISGVVAGVVLLGLWRSLSQKVVKNFLDKGRQSATLLETKLITHNTLRLKFALESSSHVLGLPAGKHIKVFGQSPSAVVEGKWNGETDKEADSTEIERRYTPISPADTAGFFELIIKVYRPKSGTKFTDGGKMSQFLETLKVGDKLQLQGPVGLHEYSEPGIFTRLSKELSPKVNRIGMVAGGTGVTPMLRLIQEVLRNPGDATELWLIFSNRTEEDILVRDQLDELHKGSPQQFHLEYTLTRAPPTWRHSKGYLDIVMARTHLPPPASDCLIALCGPPGMCDSAKKTLGLAGHERILVL